MNIQSIIVFLLGFLILLLGFSIIIVIFVGILRIAIISVFEFDFVSEWRKKHGKV